jgi:hypothetical protein
MPLVAKEKKHAINGIWLFAGEGALYNASPSPPSEEIKEIALGQKIKKSLTIRAS